MEISKAIKLRGLLSIQHSCRLQCFSKNQTTEQIEITTICQRHEYIENYCNELPIYVKCAKFSSNYPLGKQIDKIICLDCKNNHFTNYKNCGKRTTKKYFFQLEAEEFKTK